MHSLSSDSAPDTAIIGLWYTNNYGAILTAYALYRLLGKMGKYPMLADNAPFGAHSLFMAQDSLSRAFMKRNNVRISPALQSDADLRTLNDSIDTFVLGSDQVWRWRYTQKEGSFFFLDFVRAEKRKIAVSSSIGIDKEERPAALQRKAKFYLQRFDAVSVRERSAVDVLKECYNVEADWILDPVFLHGPALFEELADGCPVLPQPYVLSYVLEPDAAIRRYIETIAAERGLTIINMVDGQNGIEQLKARLGTDNVVADLTPEQWVNYIQHCSFFVTDSFHGVCFAHLFHKDFVCVAPPVRGLTRFESLLGLTGLTEHLLPPECSQEMWQQATHPIDWDRVQRILDAEREKALGWIKQALTAPRDPAKVALGRMTDELLYNGNGAADRSYIAEQEARHTELAFLRHWLPRYLRLKRAAFRLLALLPGSKGLHFRARLEATRRIALYTTQRLATMQGKS